MAVGAYDALIGAVNLRQVVNTSLSMALQKMAGRFSGAVSASEQYLLSGEPRLQFEVNDIAGALAGINALNGLYVTAGTITVPFRQRASGGTWGGSNSNFRISGTAGHAVLTSVSATQNQFATAGIDLLMLSSNGIAEPASFDVNQSVASQAFVGCYTLGPVFFGDTQITDTTAVTANLGISVMPKRYDGAIYPNKSFINEANPSIDITMEDFNQFDGYEGGVPITTVTAYLRRLDEGGTVVADSEESHIAIILSGGVATVETMGAQGTGIGSGMLKCTGNTISLSAGVAIE